MQAVGQWLIDNPNYMAVVSGAFVYVVVAAWKLLRAGEPTSATHKKIAAFVTSVLAGAAGIAATGTWSWGQFVSVVIAALGVATGIHQFLEVPLSGSSSGTPPASAVTRAFPFVLVCACLAMSAPVTAAPGDWEARTYTTVVPQPAENWGAGIAYELPTIPDDWWLVGGHKAFVDVIQLEARSILGGSVSTRKANADDGWRAWAAVWIEGGSGEYAAGLSKAVARW